MIEAGEMPARTEPQSAAATTLVAQTHHATASQHPCKRSRLWQPLCSPSELPSRKDHLLIVNGPRYVHYVRT